MYKITCTITSKSKWGLETVDITFVAEVEKYSTSDVSAEFNTLAQNIVDAWAREHWGVVQMMTKPTTPILEKWLLKINTPRLQVTKAQVLAIEPHRWKPTPLPTPSAPDLATKGVTTKRDILLQLRTLRALLHAENPELWTDGSNDGQRIDTAIEQLKGQLVGRIDPVRKALWQK